MHDLNLTDSDRVEIQRSLRLRIKRLKRLAKTWREMNDTPAHKAQWLRRITSPPKTITEVHNLTKQLERIAENSQFNSLDCVAESYPAAKDNG